MRQAKDSQRKAEPYVSYSIGDAVSRLGPADPSIGSLADQVTHDRFDWHGDGW